jgi:histidinol-phosphate aminotransferase
VLPPDSIAKLARELTCPLVVDEAYFEFYKTSSADLLKTTENLIIVRTFSKAYGLAAARVGYLSTSTGISAAVGKVLLPYHVNALSLLAAETILDYQDEFVPGIEQIIRERNRLAVSLTSLPEITVFPSETNFLLIRTEQSARLAALLAASGIGIRDFNRSPGLAGCLRISIGSPAENDLVLSVFEKFSRLSGNRQE